MPKGKTDKQQKQKQKQNGKRQKQKQKQTQNINISIDQSKRTRTQTRPQPKPQNHQNPQTQIIPMPIPQYIPQYMPQLPPYLQQPITQPSPIRMGISRDETVTEQQQQMGINTPPPVVTNIPAQPDEPQTAGVYDTPQNQRTNNTMGVESTATQNNDTRDAEFEQLQAELHEFRRDTPKRERFNENESFKGIKDGVAYNFRIVKINAGNTKGGKTKHLVEFREIDSNGNEIDTATYSPPKKIAVSSLANYKALGKKVFGEDAKAK